MRGKGTIRDRTYGRGGRLALSVVALAMFGLPDAAQAQRIENRVAVFAALDKVTARIQRLEAPIGKPVKFGSLTINVKVCNSRAPTEPPKTTTFIQIDETKLNGKAERIFSGWMFAESPGLNALEHPVYDIWLTECEKPSNAGPTTAAARPGESEAATPPPQPRRFRPRR